MPNLAAKPKGEKRLHLADEVEALRDIAQLSLRRPVDRGFVVNTQLQRDIWDRVFKRVLKARAALTACCLKDARAHSRRPSASRCRRAGRAD